MPRWTQVIDPLMLVFLFLLPVALQRSAQVCRDALLLLLVVPLVPVLVYAQRHYSSAAYLFANLALQYFWVLITAMLLPVLAVVLLRHLLGWVAHK